ncbi:MAG: GntR family transcriptional regulator [Coriobacteriales bacterium]|nr:GntR family transcriptional regulator [Coriobacteriales bacterium]
MKESAFPFQIDAQSDLPLWVQLRKRLVHLINSGHYRPGDQLPTVRGLAADLSINYNTVNKAYLSMIDDGFVTSVRGRGVFVSASDASDEEQVLEAEGLLRDFIGNCRDLGLTTWDIQKLLSRQLRQLEARRGEQGVADGATSGVLGGDGVADGATSGVVGSVSSGSASGGATSGSSSGVAPAAPQAQAKGA